MDQFAQTNYIIFVFQFVQRTIDGLATFPIWCAIANFLVSSIVAWLWFSVRINSKSEDDSIAEILEALKQVDVENISPQLKKSYRNYMRKYIAVTGLFSSAIIWLQFPAVTNFPAAIIYGALGPYILRKRLKSNVFDDTNHVLRKTFKDITNSAKAPYDDLMNDIKNDLEKRKKTKDDSRSREGEK